MKNVLTIGITTLGNFVSSDIIEFLKGKPVKVIISECRDDKSDNLPSYVIDLRNSGVDTQYLYFGKMGIANNRQNILDHVKTEYFYTIDNDDSLEGDLEEVTKFLNENKVDALYIRCYEDGKYMRIPHSFIYMCTWMQIFRTDWFRSLGGYVQSWNFIHEECATNLNLITNLGKKTYVRKILPKKYLSYKYHANSACVISFDVSQVCAFVYKIPENEKIIDKRRFIKLFKNFTIKYIPVFRVKDDGTTYLDNFVNGKYEDILLAIENVEKELK